MDKFNLNFDQWLNVSFSSKFNLRFYCNTKKWSKIRQKNPVFLGYFEKFFVYALLLPMSYAPIFKQIWGLVKIHNRGKFGCIAFLGEVKNFQIFSYRFSIHETAFLGRFQGPSSLKYGLILRKLRPEVVFKQTKTVFEKSFKTLHFSKNGTNSKFTHLVHSQAQFTPEKNKNISKKQKSCKIYILRTIE